MTQNEKIIAHLEKQQNMNALLIKQLEILNKRIELLEAK